ncbi:hypothetical protein RF11_15936 [Thelohanellus kitauei]|uniref:Uncharacterized protein n=1 Tax=Thelohanellus kitauei TaxID=669202 RepID=A0A0C2MXX0_THEKT|nr:hypothetical protein RF11_15936 [Thelohanellus kitauei]
MDYYRIDLDEEPNSSIDTFELLAGGKKWSTHEKIAFLKLALPPTLRNEVNLKMSKVSIKADERGTDKEYSLLRSTALAVLLSAGGKHDNLSTFSAACRTPGERIFAFQHRLESLIDRAIPDLSSAQREKLLRDKLLASIPTETRAAFIAQGNLPLDVLVERLSEVWDANVESVNPISKRSPTDRIDKLCDLLEKYLDTTNAQTQNKKQEDCKKCGGRHETKLCRGTARCTTYQRTILLLLGDKSKTSNFSTKSAFGRKPLEFLWHQAMSIE